MTPAPDPWATAAAQLPLAFSQVREDPQLDLEIARMLPANAQVVMVASGDDTAVCLARLPLAQLILVDVNPAQLALTRCRMHLAENFTAAECMALLGHLPMLPERRKQQWAEIFLTLNLAPDVLGPIDLIAVLGPDHAGRYEAAFAELRRQLQPLAGEIMEFLTASDALTASAMIAPHTATGRALDAVFAKALSLENLVALFGQAATQNPRQPFHRHFLQQLRDISLRIPPAENPWLWQLLAGKYPPNTPVDWLQDHSPLLRLPEYRQGSMLETLETCDATSLDFIQLSNILDWLSPQEATATLAAAYRALKPGGFILIRQLNSCLQIPVLFPALQWHFAHGDRLQRVDRSFFYPTVLLASRP